MVRGGSSGESGADLHTRKASSPSCLVVSREKYRAETENTANVCSHCQMFPSNELLLNHR